MLEEQCDGSCNREGCIFAARCDRAGDGFQIVVGAGEEVQVIQLRKDVLCILEILRDLDRLLLGLLVLCILSSFSVRLLGGLAVVVDVDKSVLIRLLILGELNVVAEFERALIIRPVYLGFLSIDGYVVAGDRDLIADLCAYRIIRVYVDKGCTYSGFRRTAGLNTCCANSKLALLRRENGNVSAGLRNDIGVVSHQDFRVICGVQDGDRTGHREIGSACRCSGYRLNCQESLIGSVHVLGRLCLDYNIAVRFNMRIRASFADLDDRVIAVGSDA